MPADARRHPLVVSRRAPGPPAAGRLLAVDGLRGISVVAIMCFHFGFGLPGGFLALDLFFVISGFVITRLLLIERERTGTIKWVRFWIRRGRRLLPAVVVVLVAVQLWLRAGAPPELRSTTNAQTIAALTYVSNWYAIGADVGYWGAQLDATPLTHLWSLAVEEQFYLVWPLLLISVLALTRSRRRLGAIAALGATVSYVSCAVLFHTSGQDRAYMGTDTRAGGLLLGVLCALALTRTAGAAGTAGGPDGSWQRDLPPRVRAVTRAACAVAVGGLAVLWATARIDAPALYEGGLGLADVAAAVIIVHVVTAPGSGAARLIGSRPLVGIGRISYSLYLWHWPVHIYAVHRWAWIGHPLVVALEFAVTFGLAACSYVLVENPGRTARRAGAVAVPLLAGGLLAFGSAAWFQPKPPVEEQNGIIVHGPAGPAR